MNEAVSEPGSLALEYFKALRAEIDLRLQEHHRLWFYKTLGCGAVLSFALSNSGVAAFGCVVTPFVAVTFDFLILNNLVVMNAIGTHIKEEIEDKYLQNGWETLSRETYFLNSKFSWLSDYLVIFLSTAVIIAMSIYGGVKLAILPGSVFAALAYLSAMLFAVVLFIFPFTHMNGKKGRAEHDPEDRQ